MDQGAVKDTEETGQGQEKGQDRTRTQRREKDQDQDQARSRDGTRNQGQSQDRDHGPKNQSRHQDPAGNTGVQGRGPATHPGEQRRLPG